MRRIALTLAAMFLMAAVALPCRAQEPEDRATVDELRREVIELRKIVAEMAKRLEAMEYQKLPRVPSVQSPNEGLGQVETSEEEWAKSKLRFPFDIERGTSAPVWRRLQREQIR